LKTIKQLQKEELKNIILEILREHPNGLSTSEVCFYLKKKKGIPRVTKKTKKEMFQITFWTISSLLKELRNENKVVSFYFFKNYNLWTLNNSLSKLEKIEKLPEVKSRKKCINCILLLERKDGYFCPILESYLTEEVIKKPYDCEDYFSKRKKTKK